jgi:hypothetical protein
MGTRDGRRWQHRLVALVAVAGTALAAPAWSAPNTGRLSWSLGNDITTAYFFRGIVQNRSGFIDQPYGELDVNLWTADENDPGPFNNLTLLGGLWFSIHSNDVGHTGESGPKHVYETDYYGGLKTTMFKNLNLGAIWYAFTFPSAAFKVTQELDLTAAYNDADLLGAFALNPSVVMGLEVDGTSFGTGKGTYFGLGIAPGYKFMPDATYPITLTMPCTLGLGAGDYYEDAAGNQDGFGYFSGGFKASIPLAFIPEDFGSWSASAGVQVLTFGENVGEYNKTFTQHTTDPWAVGTWSINMTY